MLQNVVENLELSVCVLAACSLAGAAFVVVDRISDVYIVRPRLMLMVEGVLSWWMAGRVCGFIYAVIH